LQLQVKPTYYKVQFTISLTNTHKLSDCVSVSNLSQTQ